ncbi:MULTISPECIES: DNA-directed DNA polymerase II small subunit [unclassified Methanoregula]|uniref:DNA-directed DNA polymerase II small subunit n=1 Tax=unclassified Methanoregula TaxID=2649730 RepID=UPI0009CADD09|nr:MULTISPECIES: DNA-directed DNA polymerase II small subunit [unclassified Methanoregula]OPX63110.1 MAG: DNA polymerase II small subunit [Methanoregula sp. PtaB.Bin085]OPY36333.1 MAG: DNA polymerase II small subunit [Methanoregula sp. PtaU1.Bin006]
MLDAQEIAHRFLDKKLQVHPEVVRHILEQDEPDAMIDRIIATVPQDAIVVSAKHIPGVKPVRDGMRFHVDPAVEVVTGSAGTSGAVNGTEDYLHYFRHRYAKLGGMIRGRVGAMPIEGLSKSTRYRQEECTVIGMVVDVKTTTNGHRIAEIEDATGTITVLFRKDRPVFSDAERIIHDEVIGVKGKLSMDGKLFFAELLYRPDIRIDNAPFRSTDPGKAVFISDTHVGSDTFLEGSWNKFADWLSDSDYSYLLIAGDLVDGIGIYPGQDAELRIKNIYEQYDAFGAMMKDLPSRMKIIISPGNHDVVRGAEPQPVLPEQFTKKFPDNCVLVENPALVRLQGVRVLMYHGRSIDDMIGLIPGASYEHSGLMMEEMLIRRHLAPAYGRRTPIAAGRTDRLIIDPLPEILHTGHVHIKGITQYRGVLGINAGTWQSQTKFQKQMNVNPTPALAVAVDLQTLVPETFSFA